MIILKIQGGLGNQMFQYAAGRNLSISLNTEIKLDITSYYNDFKREYELKHFRIKDIHASQSEIEAWRMPEIFHDRYRKRILLYLLSWQRCSVCLYSMILFSIPCNASCQTATASTFLRLHSTSTIP